MSFVLGVVTGAVHSCVQVVVVKKFNECAVIEFC